MLFLFSSLLSFFLICFVFISYALVFCLHVCLGGDVRSPGESHFIPQASLELSFPARLARTCVCAPEPKALLCDLAVLRIAMGSQKMKTQLSRLLPFPPLPHSTYISVSLTNLLVFMVFGTNNVAMTTNGSHKQCSLQNPE